MYSKFKYFLVLFFTLTFHSGDSQNVYYDALQLSDLDPDYIDTLPEKLEFPAFNQREAAQILKNYTVGDTSYGNIYKTFQSNPFIGLPEDAGMSTTAISGAARGELSKVGGLNVTKFAVGLSDFLIDRAKRELNVAFFEKLKDWINDQPEAEVLFPKTKQYLENIWAYEYSVMLNTLRQAFEKDLRMLDEHVLELFELPKYKTFGEKHPAVLVGVQSLQIIKNIEHAHYHPSDLLGDLYKIEVLEDVQAERDSALLFNYKNTLKMLHVLSESVRISEGSRGWISPRDIQSDILQNEKRRTIFFGLLYQQLKNEAVRFYEGRLISVADFLKNNRERVEETTELLVKFMDVADDIDYIVADIQQKRAGGDEVNPRDLYRYVHVTLNLLEYSDQVYTYINPGEQLLDAGILELAREGNALYLSVVGREYGSAIMETVIMLKTVRSQSDKEQTAFLNDLIRYGTFMANAVNAEHASGVQAALESAALPVGSSSMKKYTRANVAVQAYLGGQFNLSRAFDEGIDENTSWTEHAGIFAPVGISWTPGFCSWGRSGALSLFGSFLDIGAVVQYRLKNPETDPELSEDIKLGYILSPGGYLVYGFPNNWPLSLSAGGQYGPGMTEITDDDKVVIDPTWRWNVGLTVDIPIFTIANNEKEKLK